MPENPPVVPNPPHSTTTVVLAPGAKVDAVRIPKNYPPGKATYARSQAIRDEFGPVLGCSIVHPRELAGYNEDLLSADNQATLLFPNGHDREGQPRYTWHDRGDSSGVKYGVLAPEEGTPTNA